MTMDLNQVTPETLSQWFLHTLSPQPEPRRRAESSLSAAADGPGFSLAILRLVAEPNADEQIRHAAAVHFKNHLRSRWAPSSSDIPPIPDPDKAQIKNLIVRLMLSSPPRIRSQLSESLSIISGHDFPQLWPTLLPELVSSLRSATDYISINGLLGAANSIFKKFRYSFGTNETRLELKYCLDEFAAPLLEIFLRTGHLIAASSAAAPDILRPLLESQRLCCRIFYSLNSIELPEYFEDHMSQWMKEFKVYLTTTYPANVEADGTVDALRAAVCENLQLYMEKNEEEFKDYLKEFASSVWTLLLLMNAPNSPPSRDRLTITGIKFLTTISTSVHHALFGSPEVLRQICESIVFPNIRSREEDEELFEMNYVEYIRRDIEGSDLDTRRRIACELLKGVAVHYKEQVMAIVSVQIQNMLALYSANPVQNWREKDCAIYLVVSLATKKLGGGTEATYLIDVDSFFTSAIIPELRGEDVNAAPMLKAGALKFFTVFRNQIPKNAVISLLHEVTRFLASESNVVHSYAANCIEKLLLVKDGGGLARYTCSDINPFLPMIMNSLFNALKFPESQENPYVMKCIMRVLGVGDVVGELGAICIACLASVLGEVCKNPKDPVFNHYLFEAIAALTGRSCEKDLSMIPVFEASLFPVLQSILSNDITEFWPYAFQIFAQLVEINRPPLSQNYMQLFELLLLPESWKRSANVPALVRLLRAYLQKVPHELSSGGRLSQVLGIFNKLVSTSSTEELGFYVLNTVTENLGYDVIAPYIGDIWKALFMRLQNQRTVKFVKSFVIFMSLVLVKHGPGILVDSINAVQPNIFRVIVEQFWVPNLKLITGFVEMKLTSVASTRLICESPSLSDNSASELWGKMLDSIITLLSKPEQERLEETDVPDIGETPGYTAAFARLHNAGRKEEDPLKEIKDPKEFLVTSLARFSSLLPGKYTSIIEQCVDAANQQALQELCRTYNCAIN